MDGFVTSEGAKPSAVEFQYGLEGWPLNREQFILREIGSPLPLLQSFDELPADTGIVALPPWFGLPRRDWIWCMT
jgi:hypothetical protein